MEIVTESIATLPRAPRLRRLLPEHGFVNPNHCFQCRREHKRRIYNREMWRTVRKTTFEPHEYVKSTHCVDCRREYAREWNRDHRPLRKND